MDFQISRALAKILKLGHIEFEDVTVKGEAEDLTLEIVKAGFELLKRHGNKNPGDIEGVQVARDLYRAVGIDPTKVRPSSEALLRRVLKGKRLYKINTLVDAVNLCSLRTLIPYGLYDREKVEGDVQVRLGFEGEGYPGIRKERVNLYGRLTLADEKSPFGNPSADSERTMITRNTQRALVILFVPATYPDEDLLSHMALTREKVQRYCGGRVAGEGIARA